MRLTHIEIDSTVGNPDARVARSYPISDHDTVPAALRALETYRDRDGAPFDRNRYDGYVHMLVVDRGHPHEYGNVYRTSYLIIAQHEGS